MPDDLFESFAAFEADSLARTRPPGVDHIRRTLRRRHAVRAAALAVIALALAAAVPLSNRSGSPVPTVPDTPTPSVSPTPAGGTPAGVTMTATPRPPSTRPSSSETTTAVLVPACDPHSRGYVGAKLAGGPDSFWLTADMLKACPTLRLKIARAVYVGANPTSSTLRLSGSVSRTLSAEATSATLPAVATPGTCATYLMIVYRGSLNPPSTIANPLPNLIATGSEDKLERYLAVRGGILVTTAWSAPTCS
jgi:hypothetical protein